MHAHITKARNAAASSQPRSLLHRIGDALLGWPRRQRLLAELNALSDRELADIGLTRGEFGRALGQPEPRRAAPSRRPLQQGAALPA